ncbi:MAG: hypothetical protein ABIN01_13440 [Ferruginibacter sp.]
MEIRNSSDIYEDSGLNPLMSELKIGRAFMNNDYGNNNIKLFFVINCLKKGIKERRAKLESKTQTLYWDIMLDYAKMKKLPIDEKKKTLAMIIIQSFDILDKYKKLKIDKDAIKKDASQYFTELGWL